jgi:cell division protein FtsL
MIRVVSTFCVGLMGFTILTLYHVSEQTRIARQDLAHAQTQIQSEQSQISVLEAQWQKVASPEAVQKLAEATLGMQNATTVQLASVSQLPRRGDEPLNGEPVRAANAQMPAPSAHVLKVSARSGM